MVEMIASAVTITTTATANKGEEAGQGATGCEGRTYEEIPDERTPFDNASVKDARCSVRRTTGLDKLM
jgi:hypothetical protein